MIGIMARIPTETRQKCQWAGAITMGQSAVTMLIVVVQMLLGIWLHLIYLSALDYGLDLDTPLKDFTGERTASIISPFTSQPGQEGPVNLEQVRESVSAIYLMALLFSGITFPQMFGAKGLLKATEMDRNPKESVSLARRHKYIQIGVCALEAAILLLTIVFLFNFPDAGFMLMYIGWPMLCFVVAFRYYFIRVVERFIGELELEILDDEESWGWKQFKYQSLGKKKGEKFNDKKRKMMGSSTLGQIRIDIFKICQIRTLHQCKC